MVRLEQNDVELRPIAGTRPRGKTEQEDRALADELLSDEKERAEHVMLVDLGRNDLGRIAQAGSVQSTSSWLWKNIRTSCTGLQCAGAVGQRKGRPSMC